MKLKLTRRWETEKSITGMIDIGGIAFCFSLERPRSGDHPCIPEGSYIVEMSFSDHFQKLMPHLKDVPGRTAIMIHPANFPSELQGCIAIGHDRGQDAVYRSQDMFNLLQARIKAALETGETISIDIEKV